MQIFKNKRYLLDKNHFLVDFGWLSLKNYLFFIVMATKTVKKANRTQLIDKLSITLGVSKAQAEKTLNSVLQSVVDMVVDGYDLNLTGFGSFYKTYRKDRIGVNPKTGEKMKIAASTSVGFKVGKTFKEAVKK